MGYPELPDESNDGLDTSGVHFNNYGQHSADESDFEDENNFNGYQPLPLADNGEEIETDLGGTAETEGGNNGVPNIISSDAEIESQVWNEPRPQELGIELDNTRTEQIMNVMASITLPNSAIPEWAQRIPEEKWKQDLLDRIRHKREDIDKSD